MKQADGAISHDAPLHWAHVRSSPAHTCSSAYNEDNRGSETLLHLAEDLMQPKDTLSDLFSGCDSNLLQFGVCEDRSHFCSIQETTNVELTRSLSGYKTNVNRWVLLSRETKLQQRFSRCLLMVSMQPVSLLLVKTIVEKHHAQIIFIIIVYKRQDKTKKMKWHK